MAASDYVTPTPDLVPGTKARAEDVNEKIDAINSGFDMLPIPRADSEKGFDERIKIPDPEADQDAATKVWVETSMTSQVNQAAASAAAAAASEASAEASKVSAGVSEENAEDSALASQASALSSAASADAASASESAAALSEAAAELSAAASLASASSAAVSENAAAGSANDSASSAAESFDFYQSALSALAEGANIYKTYAMAILELGDMAADEAIVVLEDETNGGQKTYYIADEAESPSFILNFSMDYYATGNREKQLYKIGQDSSRSIYFTYLEAANDIQNIPVARYIKVVSSEDNYGRETYYYVSDADSPSLIFDFAEDSYQTGLSEKGLEFAGQAGVNFVSSAPADSAADGVPGDIFSDDSYLYFYGETGWRRVAGASF